MDRIGTTLVFCRELTAWDRLPGRMPEALRAGWDSLSPQVRETLRAELAEQGFFSGAVFSFLGIYHSARTRTVVVGFPKYWEAGSAPELLAHVALICRVAAQAGLPSGPRQEDQFQPQRASGEAGNTNPFDLAVFLLRDYAEHGLYLERVREIRSDGVGRRSWPRTLRHTRAVFDRAPLYLRPVTLRHTRQPSDALTPLHACLIRQCAALLQPLGLFPGLALPAAPPLGDKNLAACLPVIDSRLAQTYADRDLRLLRAMRSWCGAGPYRQTRFGVTAPELLWEYAVNRVFGNIRSTRSGPPRYCRRDPESGRCRTYTGTGDAIPDTLYAGRAAPDRPFVAIFDAKYYLPLFSDADARVWGAPPSADIVKQIQYLRSLRERYPAAEFSNAFLLPQCLESALYRPIGWAAPSADWSVEIAERTGLAGAASAPEPDRRVLLFQVDPARLWRACLEGARLGAGTVYEDFVRPFCASDPR